MSKGHGARWEALLGSTESAPDRLRRLIPVAKNVPKSEAQAEWEAAHGKTDEFAILAWPEGTFRLVAVLQKNTESSHYEVMTAYPMMEPTRNIRLELFDICPDATGSEAELVLLTAGGMELTVFDPLYVLHRADLVVGRQYEFGISALAYCINKASPSTEITEGPMLHERRRELAARNPEADVSQIRSVSLSFDRFRCFLPSVREEAEFQFFMKATRVDWLTMDDLEICRMVGFITHRADGGPIQLAVYASTFVLDGYRPQTGDLISGSGWFQGIPGRRLRQRECWADRPPVNAMDRLSASEQSGEDATIRFPGEHPGVLAVIHAIGSAGWDVEPVCCSNIRGHECATLARRGDHELCVWIRAFEADSEPDSTFTEDETRVRRAGATCPCAFVTVKCESADKHFRLSYTGIAEVETAVGALRLLQYIPRTGLTGNVDEDEA